MTEPKKTLELSFTRLEFFDSVVISTVKEDVIFDAKHVVEIRNLCKNHFNDEAYVYVANRKNNYNVNPVIYLNLIETGKLKAIAVVSNDIERLKTANFEKSFSPVPFELFQNKEEALVWAKGI